MINVCVVIPTFKRPALLAQALASVAAQTHAPLEVIVADNDPAACAAPVVEHAAASGLPARWVDASARPGVSAARNAGAALARGDYLAFLDDDDRWEPGYLASASALAEQTGADIVLTAIVRVDVRGTVRPGKCPPAQIALQQVLRGNPGVVGSNTFVRRNLFTRLGGFDENLLAAEDRDLLVRCLLAGVRYAACGERLVVQCEHTDERLSTEGSSALLQGRRGFYRKHRARMPPSLRRELVADLHYLAFLSDPGFPRYLHAAVSAFLGDGRPVGDLCRRLLRRGGKQ